MNPFYIIILFPISLIISEYIAHILISICNKHTWSSYDQCVDIISDIANNLNNVWYKLSNKIITIIDIISITDQDDDTRYTRLTGITVYIDKKYIILDPISFYLYRLNMRQIRKIFNNDSDKE